MKTPKSMPAYAMAVLLLRLVDEGYVKDDRESELLERAANLRSDRGFLTNAELREARLKPTKRRKATQQELDDLFG